MSSAARLRRRRVYLRWPAVFQYVQCVLGSEAAGLPLPVCSSARPSRRRCTARWRETAGCGAPPRRGGRRPTARRCACGPRDTTRPGEAAAAAPQPGSAAAAATDPCRPARPGGLPPARAAALARRCRACPSPPGTPCPAAGHIVALRHRLECLHERGCVRVVQHVWRRLRVGRRVRHCGAAAEVGSAALLGVLVVIAAVCEIGRSLYATHKNDSFTCGSRSGCASVTCRTAAPRRPSDTHRCTPLACRGSHTRKCDRTLYSCRQVRQQLEAAGERGLMVLGACWARQPNQVKHHVLGNAGECYRAQQPTTDFWMWRRESSAPYPDELPLSDGTPRVGRTSWRIAG